MVKDIEQLINEVNGTMAIEGMPLTQDDKQRIRDCLNDDKLFEKTIAELVEKHSVSK